MSGETLLPSQVRDILVTQHGVVFFEKRPLIIPDVVRTRLYLVAQPHKVDAVHTIVDNFYKFLAGQPVGDQFGADHDQRRKWRNAMAGLYGDTFLDLYYRNNQFRLNMLGLVRWDMLELADSEYIARDSLREEMKPFANDVDSGLNGKGIFSKRYKHLTSLTDKLRVVHLIEDSVIHALNHLSAHLLAE